MLARNGSKQVTLQTRELYQSANGDKWDLVRDSGSGRVFVRHQPNPSSGGQSSDWEIGTFLRAGAGGPEHQELLRLIGTLVEEPSSGLSMPARRSGRLRSRRRRARQAP
jgi:hypothetical protein